MIVVADASACASYLLPDEAGPFADFARDVFVGEDVRVPPHFPVELASILWKAQRRSRIDVADRDALAAVANGICANLVIAGGLTVASMVTAATAWRLTPYDAAYVALARDLGASILTADAAMHRACDILGIETLQP